jgi:hypothetical protein
MFWRRSLRRVQITAPAKAKMNTPAQTRTLIFIAIHGLSCQALLMAQSAASPANAARPASIPDSPLIVEYRTGLSINWRMTLSSCAALSAFIFQALESGCLVEYALSYKVLCRTFPESSKKIRFFFARLRPMDN